MSKESAVTTTKTDSKKEPDDNSAVQPVDQAPSMADVAEQAENTGLVTLEEDNGDQGLVFAANKRVLAKIKDDEPEDVSGYVTVVIVSSFVESFTAVSGDFAYVVNREGVLVPPAVVDDIITQAATQGVAVSTKAVS